MLSKRVAVNLTEPRWIQTLFLTELKRRKVYRVALAYAIVAWLLIQAASILFPTFEAPSWVMKVFVTAVSLGFPVALILAWAFELTPEGIKRSEEAGQTESITPKARSKWTAIIVGGGRARDCAPCAAVYSHSKIYRQRITETSRLHLSAGQIRRSAAVREPELG